MSQARGALAFKWSITTRRAVWICAAVACAFVVVQAAGWCMPHDDLILVMPADRLRSGETLEFRGVTWLILHVFDDGITLARSEPDRISVVMRGLGLTGRPLIRTETIALERDRTSPDLFGVPFHVVHDDAIDWARRASARELRRQFCDHWDSMFDRAAGHGEPAPSSNRSGSWTGPEDDQGVTRAEVVAVDQRIGLLVVRTPEVFPCHGEVIVSAGTRRLRGSVLRSSLGYLAIELSEDARSVVLSEREDVSVRPVVNGDGVATGDRVR